MNETDPFEEDNDETELGGMLDSASLTKPPISSSSHYTVDQLLPLIGELGRFQITLCLILSVMVYLTAFPNTIMYFTSGSPPWRCAANSSVCTENGTFNVSDVRRCSMSRSEWEFTMPDTFSIVTKFDLCCGKEWWIYLAGSAVFAGSGFGEFFQNQE